MKLTKLKVKNLLGKNNIEWNFNPDSSFNILVGNNGSGKSTLLNIIASIVADSRFDSSLELRTEDRFESVELYYRDNSCKPDNKSNFIQNILNHCNFGVLINNVGKLVILLISFN